MNLQISTDVELAFVLSDAIGKRYREGARCIEALPQYALVMFRQVVETLCEHVQRSARIPLSPTDDLHNSIRRLTEGGLITFGAANAMHRVRKFANAAAHIQPENADSLTHTQAGPRSDVLLEIARGARIDLVAVFKSFYLQDRNTPIADEIRYEEFDDLQWGQYLYLASTTFSAEDKYRAGLICEAQSERVIAGAGALVVTHEAKCQYEFLRRQAALFFQASDQLKPNDDARYRYGLAVWEGIIDADKKKDAIEIMQAVADRGHGEACLYFGVALSQDATAIERALGYWKRAVDLGYPKAYFCIGQIYLVDGVRGPDYEQVVRQWTAGAELDDPDCLYGLGRLYFDDKHVPNDVAKATQYFERAAKLGHRGARAYKQIFVDGGLQAIERNLLDVSNQMRAQAQAMKPKPIKRQKHPVNAPCHCGSGKKYKNCHGRNDTQHPTDSEPFIG